MNVSALLQDAPSDNRIRRQNREQHTQPPQQQQDREQHDRQRDRQQPLQQQHQPSPQQQPALQRTQHPPQPPQHPAQPPYHPSQSARHPRPSSPPHPYPQDHPRQDQSQRLPPPSSIISDAYDLKHRRIENEPLLHPSELAMRGPHGPPASLGPSAAHPSRSGPPPATYLVDHRGSGPLQQRGPPPPQGHSLQHLPPPHGHPNAPPMYMPPPASRAPSKFSASTSGPLYSPIGPGMGPPHDPRELRDMRDMRGPANYNEPSAMYSGHPHAPPGASIMGALPPHPSSQSRSRRSSSGGGGGFNSQNGSPAMSSLQRPEDREFGGHAAGRGGLGSGPGGPSPSQLGGLGHIQGVASHRDRDLAGSGMNSMRGAPMLSGPGSGTLQDMLQNHKEREREQRERGQREREREREREGRGVEHREQREQRPKERERREEEQRMRERERPRDHEIMSLGPGIGMLPPEGMPDSERDREWVRKMHAGAGPPLTRAESAFWPRVPYPRSGAEEQRERELREMERGRAMAKYREADEARLREAREAEWEAERLARMPHMGAPRPPSVVREREGREKDPAREAEREAARREGRQKEGRKVSREEHGWFPEPRDGWTEKMDRDARERDREQRERMQLVGQRERDRDRDRDREREVPREEMDARAARAQAQAHHHHMHHHHHSGASSASGGSVGYGGSGSKSSKRPPESLDGSLVPPGMVPPGMAPGSMAPPPFGPLTSERLPPGYPPHKPMSKMPNGLMAPVQQNMQQIPPQHLHPSHHAHLHPHAHALANPPLGFPHRRTPPPFAGALTAPHMSAFPQPPAHSPRPPLPPTLPPLHLGTFVFPHTPFPFVDFPSPPAEGTGAPAAGLSEKEVREIRATLCIPSGFLPTQRPQRARIWGGAPIPSFSPLFATPQLVHHLQSGMAYAFRRPHPLEVGGVRRVYTDDSDLFLCALHAGLVSWTATRAAKREGRDLQLEVRLTREARFVGGYGARYVRGDAEEPVPAGQSPGKDEDDGTTLLSYGWGNSHDGSGVEILRAAFVRKGTAHKTCLRNRAQRLLEYASRRSELSCGPVLRTSSLRKRRRHAVLSDDEDADEDSLVILEVQHADRKLCASRTLAFSGPAMGSVPGFKYEPQTVKHVLFNATDDIRPRKKLKSSAVKNQGVADDSAVAERTPIIIETLCETFLLAPYASSKGSDDKENIARDTASGPRYMVALLTETQPASAPKSHPQKTALPVADNPATGPIVPPPASSELSTLQPLGETTSALATSSEREALHANGIKEKLLSLDLPLGEAGKSPPGEPKVRATSKGDSDMDMSISPASENAKTPTPAPEAGDLLDTPKAKTNGSADDLPIAANNSEKASSALVEAETKSQAKPAPDADKMGVETLLPATGATTEDSAPMDVDPSGDKNTDEVPAAIIEVPSKASSQQKRLEAQVLHRNLAEEDLVFDSDGISILVGEAENGIRKGWKIEAKLWRWATEAPKIA